MKPVASMPGHKTVGYQHPTKTHYVTLITASTIPTPAPKPQTPVKPKNPVNLELAACSKPPERLNQLPKPKLLPRPNLMPKKPPAMTKSPQSVPQPHANSVPSCPKTQEDHCFDVTRTSERI